MRGVSEVTASVLLAAVVLAGMGAWLAYSSKGLSSASSSLRSAVELQERRIGEALSLIYSEVEGSSSVTLHLYLYNYGFHDVEISKAFVNGNEFSFQLLEGGNPASGIARGKLVELRIASVPPSQAYEVVILTSSGRVFSWEVKAR